MKKYIEPSIEVVETLAEEVICTSPEPQIPSGGQEGNVNADAPLRNVDLDGLW